MGAREKSRVLRAAIAAVVAALAIATAVWAQEKQPTNAGGGGAARTPEPGEPRYLATIRAELDAMGIAHACEGDTPARGLCSWRHRDANGDREDTIQLVYSDETDTAYMWVDRIAVAPPDAASTPAVLRRAMEINWRMLVGKLEWDPSDGEMRLAVVLHTDSNFDRRAFRSLVRSLGTLADRYGPELRRLSASD